MESTFLTYVLYTADTMRGDELGIGAGHALIESREHAENEAAGWKPKDYFERHYINVRLVGTVKIKGDAMHDLPYTLLSQTS